MGVDGGAATRCIRNFEVKIEAGMTGNMPAALGPLASSMPEEFKMKPTDHWLPDSPVPPRCLWGHVVVPKWMFVCERVMDEGSCKGEGAGVAGQSKI